MKKLPIAIAALVAIIAIAVAAALPGESLGQDSITVTHRGVENQFPDGLRFYINAESASPIAEIRVYVRKLGQSSRSTYRAVEFEPGSAISGEALFRSKTANEYIPTGTRLSYYFDIRTADGQTLETEPETIVYLNTGLDWQATSHGLIDVYYYHHNSESELRAEAVLSTAVDTYLFMEPILGVELTEPMSIVVYSDYGHMQDALQPASRVAAQHLRTLGKAFTNERALLVDGSLGSILTTAAHEFTHLLVADSAGSAYSQVPTWLNEGLAVYSERQPDSEYEQYMRSAIRNDRVPPLAGLRTFAGTPRETLQNYGQGHAVAAYMLDAYGSAQMAELFATLRATHNFNNALAATYGLTIPELDNEWRGHVGLAPRDLSTPPPPPLQVLPTRRPTPAPTPTRAPADSSASVAPAATPTPTPTTQAAPTYTPLPPPTASGTPGGSPAGGCAAPADGAGPEVAALALLTIPLGLASVVARRRRRQRQNQPIWRNHNARSLV